jgi:hypothetical protein
MKIEQWNCFKKGVRGMGETDGVGEYNQGTL